MKLSVGTKSLLFGVHSFWLHPFLVLVAWFKLYSWPKELPIYISFICHDLGYLGKTNMDGPEGETHPESGAQIMHRLFDKRIVLGKTVIYGSNKWRDFCLYHSRTYAARDSAEVSKLCCADKVAILLMPRFLFLFLARLSGEINEYKETDGMPNAADWYWYESLREKTRTWVLNNCRNNKYSARFDFK